MSSYNNPWLITAPGIFIQSPTGPSSATGPAVGGITLYRRTDDPPATGAMATIYAKEVSGVTQLFFMGSTGPATQIANSSTGPTGFTGPAGSAGGGSSTGTIPSGISYTGPASGSTVQDIDVKGNYLFAISNGDTFNTLSRSATGNNGSNWESLNTFTIAGANLTTLKINGNTAYIGTSISTVYSVDITQPSNPSILDSIAYPGNGNGFTEIDFYGNYLYIGDSPFFVGIDISVPSNLRLVFESPTQALNLYTGIHVNGNLLYTTRYDTGTNVGTLEIWDLTVAGTPTLLGSIAIGAGTQTASVAVDGARAYVVGGDAFLRVYDVSDPTTPLNIFTSAIYGTAAQKRAVIAGTYLYTVGWSGSSACGIVNIANPYAPVLVGSITPPSSIYNAVKVQAEWLYYAGNGSGTINIYNPTGTFIQYARIGTAYSSKMVTDDMTVLKNLEVRGSIIGMVPPPLTTNLVDYAVYRGWEYSDVNNRSRVGFSHTITDTVGTSNLRSAMFIPSYRTVWCCDSVNNTVTISGFPRWTGTSFTSHMTSPMNETANFSTANWAAGLTSLCFVPNRSSAAAGTGSIILSRAYGSGGLICINLDGSMPPAADTTIASSSTGNEKVIYVPTTQQVYTTCSGTAILEYATSNANSWGATLTSFVTAQPTRGIAFSPIPNRTTGTHHLYVGSNGSSAVFSIRPGTPPILSSTISTSGNCSEIIYVPSTREIWVSHSSTTVEVIDPARDIVIRTITTPENVGGMCYHKADDRVYLQRTSGATVYVYDPRNTSSPEITIATTLTGYGQGSISYIDFFNTVMLTSAGVSYNILTTY